MAALCVELLGDVREGRPGAWERMLDEFGPTVLAEARRAGLDDAQCEDVFQSTWLALHRSLPRIREPGAVVAWIVTTARRESWRARRRLAVDGSTSVDDVDPESGAEGPEHSIEKVERERLVRRGVEALDERCRRLLERLFFADERPSYPDVAASLSMKVGSVGPTRTRCLGKLAGWLERNGFR